jgi:hypothetical protein
VGDGTLVFGGSFITSPGGQSRTLAAAASVQLVKPDGSVATAPATEPVDAGGRSTRVDVPVDPRAMGLVPGRRYGFRLLLATNRRRTGASAERSFVYRVRRSCAGGPRAALRLTGTRRADRLVGGRGPDRIRGGRGADTLLGCAGADTLDPGRGRDVVSAGGGRDHIRARDGRRDVVRCGRGRDLVRADRLDRLSGCERVLRPRARRRHG